MNINLGTNYPLDENGQPEPFQAQLAHHQQVMEGADFDLVGPPVLIPDPDPNYPGAYQVWSPCRLDGVHMWVWVTPDGEAVYTDFLPLAEDMESRG